MRLFFFFSFFFFFYITPLYAAQETAYVGYKSAYISVLQEKAYIDLSLWYPSAKRGSLQQIGSEYGDSFLISKNAPLAEGRFPLLVISHPTFGNRFSYSNIAYGFAKQGFIVACITHAGDNKDDMRFTLRPKQFPERALQIKSTLEFLINQFEHKNSINKSKVSLLAFGETALTGLLLSGVEIDSVGINEFCKDYPEDYYCSSAVAGQMQDLSLGIDFEKKNNLALRKQYSIDVESITKQNELNQKEWKKEFDRAQKRKQTLPVEPIPTPLPAPVIDYNYTSSLLTHMVFVDPSLAFLIDKTTIDKYILPTLLIYTKELTYQPRKNQINILHSLFKHSPKEMLFEQADIYSLMQPCTDELAFLLPEVCFCSSEKRELAQEEFVQIVSHFLLQGK